MHNFFAPVKYEFGAKIKLNKFYTWRLNRLQHLIQEEFRSIFRRVWIGKAARWNLHSASWDRCKYDNRGFCFGCGSWDNCSNNRLNIGKIFIFHCLNGIKSSVSLSSFIKLSQFSTVSFPPAPCSHATHTW